MLQHGWRGHQRRVAWSCSEAHNPTPPSPLPPRALEDAIYEEAGYEEECSREHAVRALLRVDLDMTEKAAQQVCVGGVVVVVGGGLRDTAVPRAVRPAAAVPAWP